MENIISWLLEGVVSIQYMVHRYLLGTTEVLPEMQNRKMTEDSGKDFWIAEMRTGIGESIITKKNGRVRITRCST